jgi:Skp family chaperone for outer membrane proteins
MKPTLNEKFLAYLALFSGLSLSIVAEYYSILGLTAIFSAAAIPVIVMGIALGLGKVSATLWLKQNWKIAPWSVRIYLFVAILVLMMVTSMGIFGFLSKAHSDASLVSGDVQAKIAVYDEKIQTAKDNIDANRKALKQMDEAVDQVMARSSSETGADKAVGLRRSQLKERARLQSEIQAEQKTISRISEERAPIAAEVRKVEAEVGPIKYIAQFVYGETSEGLLEKAVTWVIIILIVVFDPLAVILLLSSQISFQRFREQLAEGDSLSGPVVDIVSPKPTVTEQEEATEGDSPEKESDVISTATVTPPQPEAKVEEKSILEQHPYLNKPFAHFTNLKPMVAQTKEPVATKTLTSSTTVTEDDDVPVSMEFLNDRPGDYLTTSDSGSLFVQNEEQKESNRWSETVAITHDEYVAKSAKRKGKS